MKREFMIERQGRSFVLYAGLLDEAHRAGLRAIRTKLLQSPSADNGNVAICYAEVETEKGTFSGIGDATPDNVGRTVAPHFIRMAETRAKARALRDAINVGAVAVEELADLDEERDTTPDEPRHGPVMNRAPVSMNGGEPGVARQRQDAAPTPINARAANLRTDVQAARGDLATPAQVRAIYLIGRDEHGLSDQAIEERSLGLFGQPPAELTRKQASRLITSLKAHGQPAAS